MNTVLKVNQLEKTYLQGSLKVEVLKGLNLEVTEGETVAIVGSSGSGKSTLLGLLAGLDQPNHVSVELSGKELSRLNESQLAHWRGEHMGIVFQQFHLLKHLTAAENVSLPLELAHKPYKADDIRFALAQVGLEGRGSHYPHQLSGGENQRVAIARAMILQPKILLADEPSGSLDNTTGNRVMKLLFDQVKERKMTMVLVTHNDALAQDCDRTLILNNGSFEAC